MAADTNSSSEAIGYVPFVLGICWHGLQLPFFVQEPLRAEIIDVGAVDLRIVVQSPESGKTPSATNGLNVKHGYLPNIHQADRVLRDEVPLVPIVLGQPVWDTQSADAVPPQRLLHHCLDVWKTVVVLECGHPVAPDDAINLCLCAGLNLGVENHCFHKPGELARCLEL